MICRLCFGRPLGFIANHGDCYEFLQTLEQRLPIVEKFSIYTEVSSLLSFISYIPWLNRVLPSATDKNGIGRLIGVNYTLASCSSDQCHFLTSLPDISWDHWWAVGSRKRCQKRFDGFFLDARIKQARGRIGDDNFPVSTFYSVLSMLSMFSEIPNELFLP